MSWSLGATFSDKSDVENALRESLNNSVYADGAINDGVEEQMEVAMDAVKDLVRSGAFGEAAFSVSLTGHAKQGEDDQVGNMVSIYLTSDKRVLV